MVELTLFDIQSHLIEAWTREFGDEYPEVTIIESELDSIEDHDCLVSPSNSFGLMDDGINLAISTMLPTVQSRVQKMVADTYYGEQPVGTSLIVSTGDERFPYIAHTPTMRFPRNIQAEAVYDATRAMLMAVMEGDEVIETVACPGLGTAGGAVGPNSGARMMRLAYDSIFRRDPEHYASWEEADKHLHKIYDMGVGI